MWGCGGREAGELLVAGGASSMPLGAERKMRRVGEQGGSQHRPSQSCGLQQRSAADLPALLCKHCGGCTCAQNNVLLTPCLARQVSTLGSHCGAPASNRDEQRRQQAPVDAVHATYHQLRAVSDCELPLTDEMPA